MLKRFAGILSALILSAAGAVAFATPAQAAGISTKICYSSDSTDHHRLRIWFIDTGVYYYVNYGDCGPWLGNSYDQMRVNTCPDGNYISYYVIKSDSGYGPHHNGCNSASNPPNYNGYVYYKMMN